MKDFYNNLLYLVQGIMVGAIVTGSPHTQLIICGGLFMILLLILRITFIDIGLQSGKVEAAKLSLASTVVPFTGLFVGFLAWYKTIGFLFDTVASWGFIATASFATITIVFILSMLHHVFKNYMKTIS